MGPLAHVGQPGSPGSWRSAEEAGARVVPKPLARPPCPGAAATKRCAPSQSATRALGRPQLRALSFCPSSQELMRSPTHAPTLARELTAPDLWITSTRDATSD